MQKARTIKTVWAFFINKISPGIMPRLVWTITDFNLYVTVYELLFHTNHISGVNHIRIGNSIHACQFLIGCPIFGSNSG